jgi:hypothetical protein
VLGHAWVLLLVLTFVALYVRLPAGARAAIAASLGALSISRGALTVLGIHWNGFRLADLTGLLLLPLGAALLAASVALLSRRERRGPAA